MVYPPRLLPHYKVTKHSKHNGTASNQIIEPRPIFNFHRQKSKTEDGPESDYLDTHSICGTGKNLIWVWIWTISNLQRCGTCSEHELASLHVGALLIPTQFIRLPGKTFGI